MTTTVTVVGCGDAFGSGGRFNTCFLVDSLGLRFAIDFGATSLVALSKLGIDHNTIDAIVLTHFHGDHCGGVPFMVLDAMLGAGRKSPLAIIGPRNTRARMTAVADALLPGMSAMVPKFALAYHDYGLFEPFAFGPLSITGYPAAHTGETSPCCVRIQAGDKVVSYTGDSAWTDDMPALAQDADLFICESYHFDKPVRFHLNYRDIAKHRSELHPKRILLTHFSREMLRHEQDVREECAHDGLVFAV
jgi:ribonuclease BN (tRNA processing enzyme)